MTKKLFALLLFDSQDEKGLLVDNNAGYKIRDLNYLNKLWNETFLEWYYFKKK